MNRTGTVIDWIAHTVELLLEHQSIPSCEFVARMACALRNERTVKILVPPRKVDCKRPASGLAAITLSITWVVTMPSLRRSFCGFAVLLKYGVFGWVT